jgi:hypothetical protein
MNIVMIYTKPTTKKKEKRSKYILSGNYLVKTYRSVSTSIKKSLKHYESACVFILHKVKLLKRKKGLKALAL